MKTYKICIESWTGSTKTKKGYKFHNRKSTEIKVVGFRSAISKAKETEKNLKDKGLFSAVIVRDMTPGALCGIARKMF